MKILLLILTLPTEQATLRMRVWRTLKSSGAAVLRDGVYLMPDKLIGKDTFDQIAGDVRASGATHLSSLQRNLRISTSIRSSTGLKTMQISSMICRKYARP